MSIQISVTIWTILCFLALMLILDRLLFRPMLTFMDRRKEKIERAGSERKRAEQALREELRRREDERHASEQKVLADSAAALDAQREENARLLAAKKAENAAALEALDSELERESEEILTELQPRTEELIRAFTARVQEWRTRIYDESHADDSLPRAGE